MGRKAGPRRIPICGHPEASCHARGLCSKCYYLCRRDELTAKAKGWYHRNKGRAKNNVWANHIKREYGLSSEDYFKKLAAQGGVCAICRLPPIDEERLCVDHCHRTGRNRGLLHRECNLKLHVLEQPNWLDQAYLYLCYWNPPLGITRTEPKVGHRFGSMK